MAAPKIPPGPRGLPLIGSALAVFRDPLGFSVHCARTYGDVVRVRVGTLVFYLLCHPQAIEQVLRQNARNFIKDQGTRMLSAVLGQGLLTSEGEHWRRQRRLAQPAFQLDQIQKYGTSMVVSTQRLLAEWRPGQTRDLHADMMRLTLEIVAQTLFGAAVADKAERVGRAMEQVTEFYATPIALFPFLQRLPLPILHRFRRAVRDIDAVLYETIAERRASGPGGDDLLGRFLSGHETDGDSMTDLQLRDELMTLFLAGHETTAIALSFCFYLLASHPRCRQRLEAELDEVLQGRPPTIDMVPRLRYAEWVVREAMRVYPPVPSIGREAVADCEIMGFAVPKGTQMALMQWVTHRDPRWFDDPEVFRPERWDNDLARRLPRCAYFPFGDGARICIGNYFAMMEAVLVLTTIAQRYQLELAPDFKLALLPSVTLRPKGGVKVVLRERIGAAAQLGPISHQ